MRTEIALALRAAFNLCLLLLPLTASAFYNPAEGKWLSRDPIGEEDGPSDYAFLLNNPLFYIDRNGLDGAVVVLLPAAYADTDGKQDGFEESARNSANRHSKERGWLVFETFSLKNAHFQLLQANCKCISELNIAGHGNAGFINIVSKHDPGRTNVGYGRLEADPDGNGGFKVSGLEIFEGVNFCKTCKIVLRSCGTGATRAGDALLKAIGEKTKCTVQAYCGLIYPDYDHKLPGYRPPEKPGPDAIYVPK